MLSDLDEIARDPNILINGNTEATNLFFEMTSVFFKSTKDQEFRPGSGGELSDLVSGDSVSKWTVWEQIRRQNEALLSAISTVNLAAQRHFSLTGEANPGIEPQEESDDAGFDALGHSDNDEEEDPPGLEALGSSEIDNEEEEGSDSEIERLLAAEGSDSDTKPIMARDFYGADEDSDPRQKKVREIEERLISQKPWEMSGETVACERPTDALVDIDVDFDFTSTAPPVPLPTSELETLLIGRIESMRFDDVVRKSKPTHSAAEAYQISTEKPKLGLADEYAALYGAAQGAVEQAGDHLTPSQKLAIELGTSLFKELDRFTEHRYLARRPRERIEVKQGVALEVDEPPQPTRRPEEGLAPIGSARMMKGETEVTPAERKARLRVRKEHGKKRREEKDAQKGVLFSQSGRDGAEVQAKQDVDRLLKRSLPGVEVVAPGGKVQAERQKPKNVNRNFLK
jgi:U3 small nucleolar RNA-associated protein MPP10